MLNFLSKKSIRNRLIFFSIMIGTVPLILSTIISSHISNDAFVNLKGQ